MPPHADPRFLEIASALRALARDPSAHWSFGVTDGSDGLSHSEDEMIRDHIGYEDAVEVIQTGTITDAELYGDDLRFRVEGNSDGRPLVFIVEFSSEERVIEIVTGWAK